MPNIQSFDSPVLDIRPTEIGIEATAAAARRGGSMFNAAGEAMNSLGSRIASTVKDVGQVALDYEDHREISAGAKNLAQMQANLIKEWNDKLKDPNLDPNDPSTGPKFLQERLEPALEQYSSGFNTEKAQNWAQAHVAQFRQHMFHVTAADTAQMAADAAKTNTVATINTLSNTVRDDPSGLDFALKTLDGSVEGMIGGNPNLTGTQASRFREEVTQAGKQAIVKSAVFGAITKDPEAGMRLAQDPRYAPYINGAELKTFAAAAKTQAKTDLLRDKQIQTYARQQEDFAVHVDANKNFSDNVTYDPATNRAVIKPEFFNRTLDIVRQHPDSPIASTVAKTYLDWGEHQQNQKTQTVVSDPVLKSQLYSGLFDPNKPTTEVDLMRAQIEGKLSPHDFTAMHQLQKSLEETPLKGEVMKDTLAAVKADLTYSMPGMPGRDPNGLKGYSAFIQKFVPEYLRQSRAGTLQPNALDLKDPNSLISQAMAPFKRTPSQLLKDRIDELGKLNLTGEGKTVTGVEVVNAEPIPAAPQRVVNKVYELPKGKFKWNGSGWEKP